MAGGVGLVFDLLAKDGASPTFLKVAGAADKTASSTLRATEALGSLTARSKELKLAQLQLTAAQERYNAVAADSSATAGKLASAQASLIRAQERVATATRAVGTSLDAVSTKAAATGATLTKKLTLPITAIGGIAVVQAAKYQSGLNTIAVATDQSTASMAQAQKGMLAISRETATSTDQLQQALYTAAKSGQPMSKALDTVRAAAQGAKAEGADLGTVTNALTSIMASYGSKMKNPVAAMDELVRGSGLAKTTLQDFADSLSNVVPLASSLGIGFDQVAGAIDTMTQHGETAQRATDNLANLITNLAGQNNVASQSLQQLGVNTVSLSQNLGKRGLTGTLDVVLSAINKHGRDGMIVTSAFKQAATATASLKTELSAMPPAMQKNAAAFDAGTMSYKDFYAYAKSLGGQQFQMAKGFINTEAQAKGFNNQLKSGNGTVRTLATTLQKSLGGVTGMRTALMLTGSSAATLAHDTKAVGDAAKGAGKDVVGFGQTQQNTAFKADKAKQAFHSMAVELGYSLIPFVNKLADDGTKVIGFFDGLSSGQKKLIGYGAVALAALGPVLSITGRMVKVFGLLNRTTMFGPRLIAQARSTSTAVEGVGSAATSTATRVAEAESAQTRAVIANNDRQIASYSELAAQIRTVGGVAAVGAAEGGAARAVAGAPIIAGGGGAATPRGGFGRALGLGAGIGLMIGGQYAGDALQAHGHETSGTVAHGLGYGALAGAAFGMPVIGAGVGALTAYGLSQSKSIPVSKQDSQYLSLVQQAQKLGIKTPALKLNPFNGLKTGVSAADVKNLQALVAARQQQAATTKLAAAAETDYVGAIMSTGKFSKTTATSITQAAIAQSNFKSSAEKAGLTQKDLTNAIQGSNAQFDRTVDWWKRWSNPSQAQINQLTKLRAAYQNQGKAAQTAAIKVGATLPSMRKSGTETALLTGKLENLNKAHYTGKQASGIFSQALFGVNTAIEANGKTLDQNTVFGQQNTIAIKKAASAAILHAQAVYQQTGSVKKAQAALASDRQELIQSATAAGLNKKQVDALLTSMGLVSKAHPHTKVTADTATAEADVRNFLIDLNSIHDRTVTVNAVTRYTTVVGGAAVTNNQVKSGNAAGTDRLPDGYFTVGERGWELGYKRGSKVQIFDNHTSQKLTGWKRVPGFAAGTKPDQGTLSSAVSSAIGTVGAAYSPKFNINDVGLPRITSQIDHAIHVLNDEIHKGLSKHTADVYRREIAQYVAAANAQLSNLRVKVNKNDLNAIKTGLKGTVDDTAQAFSNLITDVKNMGGNSTLLNRLKGAQSALVSNQNTLINAKQYKSDVMSTLQGSFDSTQYGSVTDLLAGFGGATSKNNAYGNELKTLRSKAKGNSTLLGYINQLAQSGQTATLQTLAGASSAQLAQVSKAVGSYNTSLNNAGDQAEQTKVGVSIDALTKKQTELVSSLSDVVKAFARPQHMHLHLNGHELTMEVVRDPQFDKAMAHMVSELNNQHTYH